MQYKVTVLPSGRTVVVQQGTVLLDVLRQMGETPEAPCGGNGKCGKCGVTVNGTKLLSCGYAVDSDITVEVPRRTGTEILTYGFEADVPLDPIRPGYSAAFDIGTTTVVCFLLSPGGKTVVSESMLNPQSPFGADVVSRIRCAMAGEDLTGVIRGGMTELIKNCCGHAGIAPEDIGVISVVGNPCMQQLFLGLPVDNLASVPFAPVITRGSITPAAEVLPLCPNAELITVPDISGYVGADTMGCVLATRMYEAKDTVLMVDIGTNGEMVLIHEGKMVACSTAAGPALEGANITFGIRGSRGAIDHVTRDGCTVIGGVEAQGICGSGLIDAVAVMLDKGLLNKRGRVLTENHNFHLTDKVYLTQEDIRQVQLAKGAIAAGVELMAQHLGTTAAGIDRCILAGAFGSFLDPDNACRIGLLPAALRGKITAAGNIAGSGARMLAKNKGQLSLAGELIEKITFLELANAPGFQRTFAKNMGFEESK